MGATFCKTNINKNQEKPKIIFSFLLSENDLFNVFISEKRRFTGYLFFRLTEKLHLYAITTILFLN